ncbi:MAG: hypothetical protein ACM3ZS_04900 [Nitrososphaerota archaeon]
MWRFCQINPYLGISKVKYDKDHVCIDRAIQHLIDDDGIHEGKLITRKDLLSNLSNRIICKVIIPGPNKTWDYGADIKIVTIHGTGYIKTDSNPIPCDKIGNLPEY